MARNIIHDHVTFSTTIGKNTKNIIYPENTAEDVLLNSDNVLLAEFGEKLRDIVDKIGVLAFLNTTIDDHDPSGYKKVESTYPGALEIVSNDIEDDLFNSDTQIKMEDVEAALNLSDDEENPFSVGDYVIPDSYDTEMSWSANKISNELENIIEEMKDYTLSREEIESRLEELDGELIQAIANEESNFEYLNSAINKNNSDVTKWQDRLSKNITIGNPLVKTENHTGRNGLCLISVYDNGEGVNGHVNGGVATWCGWELVSEDLKYTHVKSLSNIETDENGNEIIPDGYKKIISSYMICSQSDEGAIQVVESTTSGAPEDDNGNPTIDNPTKIPAWFLGGITDPESGVSLSEASYVREYTDEELAYIDLDKYILYKDVRFNIHYYDTINVDEYVTDFVFDSSRHVYISDLDFDDTYENIIPDITTKWEGHNKYYLNVYYPHSISIHDSSESLNLKIYDGTMSIDYKEPVGNAFTGSSSNNSDTEDTTEDTAENLITVNQSRTTVKNELGIGTSYYCTQDIYGGISFKGPKPSN